MKAHEQHYSLRHSLHSIFFLNVVVVVVVVVVVLVLLEVVVVVHVIVVADCFLQICFAQL